MKIFIFLLFLSIAIPCPFSCGPVNHSNYGVVTNGNLVIDYCVAEPAMWISNTNIMINRVHVLDRGWKIRLYNCMSHDICMYKQIIKNPAFIVYTTHKDESIVKHEHRFYFASVETMYFVEWYKPGIAWWAYWIDKKNCKWAWKDCCWYYTLAWQAVKNYLRDKK